MELFVIGLLIVLGTVLLVAEIALIPGLGFTGITGVGAMIASAVYAFMQLGEIAGWITIAIVIFVAIALILWAIYGKSLDNVALKENIVSTVADAGASNIKVSDRGVTVTRLALIGEVKNNPRMHIPIIGNGDITTPERARECFDRYGVDAVMIGRASFGRPWIFREVKHYLETGEHLPTLTFDERMDILRDEVNQSVARLDERRGILHIRRHLAATPLFKGLHDFKQLRIAMLRAETIEELSYIFEQIKKQYS
jgi:hypothetical protein